VQVAEVKSRVLVSPRHAGPFVGSHAWPTAGSRTQVFVVASHVAYETQSLAVGLQAAPTASGRVQTDVVASHRSVRMSHPSEPADGSQCPPVPTGALQTPLAESQ
jgi:hypothetical protein